MGTLCTSQNRNKESHAEPFTINKDNHGEGELIINLKW